MKLSMTNNWKNYISSCCCLADYLNTYPLKMSLKALFHGFLVNHYLLIIIIIIIIYLFIFIYLFFIL